MTPKLRLYQTAAIDAVRESYRAGRRAPLLVAPTGAGKTVILAAIAGATSGRHKRVLILCHRRELIRQASRKLHEAGVPHGVIAPGFTPNAELVQVASVQTLGRRLDRLPPFDLIVIDEAHHAVAGQWAKVIAAQSQARLLGVTATPERMDGQGLGNTFDDLVLGPSVAELIAGGFLTPSRVFAPQTQLDLTGVAIRGGDYEAGALARRVDVPTITGDVVAHYRSHAAGLPAIAFCVSVEHAGHVAASFRAAGWRATSAHGGQPLGERDAAIGGLATGAVQVLACCDLISEGLDVPDVGAVILLRPTKSLGLHVQQVGRGLRPVGGTAGDPAAIARSRKPALIVLDHVGNTLLHGLPDTEHEWSLEGRTKRARDAVPATWRCPKCFAVQRPTRACVACGHVAPVAEVPAARVVEQTDGALAEVDRERIERLRTAPYQEVVRAARTVEDLREVARARGYKPSWVFVQMKNRHQQQMAQRPRSGTAA